MNTRRTRRNNNPVVENEDNQESNKETQSRKRIKNEFDSSNDENSRPAENDLEEARKSNESKRSKFDTDEEQSSDDEKLQNISTGSRKRRIPQLKDDDDSSSSDSSVGDYLKNADEIDLNSTFFQFKDENPPDFGEIEKKMFTGVHVHSLSDSEESESNLEDNTETLNTSEIQIESSQNTSTFSNFTQLNKYNEKLEEAKACVQNYEKKIIKHQKKTRKDKNIEDINHLLSIGEKQNRESIDSSHILTSEDEDWEEIQESVKEEPKIPKEGVQITVELPGVVRRKKKSEDLMAAIKRRINRVKKENQVFVHKVHLLCWIAHGNFLNNILNNETLLAQALSLLPSDQCYPPKNADISYLEQIVRWYGKMMKLNEIEQDNQTPVKDQLNLQINKKQANCKRNFILLFIIILRSLGLQCRLVLSFQCLPLRPLSSELCSLSTKDNKSNDKKEKSKPTTSKDTKNSKIKSKAPTLNTSIKNKLDRKLNDSIKHTLNSSKSFNTSNIKKTITKSSKIDKHVKTESNNKNISEKLKKGTSKKLTLKEKLDINSEKITPEQSTSKATPPNSGTKSEKEIDKSIKTENNKNNSKISKNGISKKLSLKEKLDKNTEKITLEPSTSSETKHHSSETKSIESILKSKNSKKSLKEKLDKNLSLDKKDVKPKKSVRISQVDGADDSPRKTKSKPKQTLSDKLKKNLSDSESEFQVSERQKRKSRSKPIKYFESPLTAESDFQANRETPSPTKSVSKSPKDINHNKPSTSKDVRNDIISLIKGSMVEHRYKEQLNTVRKKSKDSDYDSDFMPETSSKGKSKKKLSTSDKLMSKIKVNTKVKRRIPPKSEIDRRVLSSDDDALEVKKKGNDVWLEVFLEEEEKWISVDLIKGQVHCVSELYNRASHPMSYVVAWNNNLSLKDISARYCPNWNTVTRKLRVDPVWWHETLKPFTGTKTIRDKEEDEDLARQQLDKPLPTTINEYKNHPLYALKRHLLKFEAIYPPDALILGFVRKEPVYARECVHTLRSREIWVKEAKVVKPKQEPYKIVKARPKYDRLTGNVITDLPLELFGIWQVEDYVPPTAENGVVPRNAFGNVELFKACMLPKKTVHLQLPGLNRIARKLNIDCAPAVVGFDFHCGGSHPTFDGFVVCEEFKDTLIAAWEQDRDETAKREQEKYEKRVYGNWRKLIKGLLIRERLKARYDFGDMAVTKKVKPSKAKKSKTDG